MADETTGEIAQWYPQVAAYDDLVGWDTRPYLSNGEFYLEYGTIDLAITVPAGTVVVATGELTNAEEVLPAAVRERLAQAVGNDDVVHVVTADDFGPGKATRGRAGETLTWRFHAEDVRDAAFAFSDHYLWDATSGLVDEETGRRTAVHTLYRPTANNWVDSAKMAKGAVETFSRNAHEIGHEWFPMMVGSDETAYAWLDEGVNTFITIFASEDYYPNSTERREVRDEYRGYARTNNVYMGAMAPPDGISAGGANLGALGYRHPATALLALREILGHETYDRALNEYTDRWLYKHPAPFDFFNTFEEVAGQDLDWFWVPWLYGPGISDHAIGGVERNWQRGEGAGGGAGIGLVRRPSRDTGEGRGRRYGHPCRARSRGVVRRHRPQRRRVRADADGVVTWSGSHAQRRPCGSCFCSSIGVIGKVMSPGRVRLPSFTRGLTGSASSTRTPRPSGLSKPRRR